MACTVLAAQPVGALTPMLPHDFINGCFQLKPGSIELTAEGARGLRALIQLISLHPSRIMGANVTVVRLWPEPRDAYTPRNYCGYFNSTITALP
jgi:hypothetical protein